MSQGVEVVMEHGPLVMEPQVVHGETRADPLASAAQCDRQQTATKRTSIQGKDATQIFTPLVPQPPAWHRREVAFMKNLRLLREPPVWNGEESATKNSRCVIQDPPAWDIIVAN
jgi:hypothetical protein